MHKKYILNLGLAFTLLYAGISSFLFPSDWLGFVPDFVNKLGVTKDFALQGHAAAEIVLGLLLLTNWKVKWVSALVALDIAVILIVTGFSRGALLVTFRDVGLLMMAIYLSQAEE